MLGDAIWNERVASLGTRIAEVWGNEDPCQKPAFLGIQRW